MVMTDISHSFSLNANMNANYGIFKMYKQDQQRMNKKEGYLKYMNENELYFDMTLENSPTWPMLQNF